METKNFKKIFYGAIVAATVCAVLSVRFDCVEDIFNALQPVATLLIGFVLVFIAIDNYKKTIDHKFFVGFKVTKKFLSNEWGYIFDEKEKFNYTEVFDKKIATNYITDLYAHNENNKVEVISKVYLQLKNGEIILILDLDSKPLFVAPYAIKDFARADDVEREQMAHFFTPTDFYQKKNQEDINIRAYVFSESNTFNDKENKIIVESRGEHFYVVPNVLPKNQNSKKIKKEKIDANLFVRSILQANKPIIFNHQIFLYYRLREQNFSNNLCILANVLRNINPEINFIGNDELFFLQEIIEGLTKVSKEQGYPFSQSNFIKGFGFCVFWNSNNFKNSYVSSFYDSGSKKYFLPVKQKGQDILYKFNDFNSLINSIFLRNFETGESTDFLIFEKKPEIIE